GLDAGGLEPDGDTVGAQRALVGLVVALGDARDVEGATGDAVAAADAVLLVKIHDAIGVLHDRARRRAGLQAPGVRAVHAPVLADQPFQIALGSLDLGEAHQRPAALAQVVRILILPGVGADLIAQIVPLHAGHLAGLAADALGGVDELGHTAACADRADVR